MPIHPSLVLVVFAAIGIAMACLVMSVGVLWARVRSLPVEETTRLVDDLARRQESIEELLGRLDVAGEQGRGAAGTAGVTARARASASPKSIQRADPAATTAVGRPTLIAVPSLSATGAGAVAEASAAEAAEELGRRFGAIWALADAGETVESIARTIGQPMGQVELILRLRRHLSQTGQPGGRA